MVVVVMVVVVVVVARGLLAIEAEPPVMGMVQDFAEPQMSAGSTTSSVIVPEAVLPPNEPVIDTALLPLAGI